VGEHRQRRVRACEILAVLSLALVVGNPENYPQTGLEEINGDLREADFWLALPKVRPGPLVSGS